MRFFVKKKIKKNLRLPLYNLRLPLYFVYLYFWIYMLKFLCTIIPKKKRLFSPKYSEMRHQAFDSQVKSSKFYCQFFHMYSTYIQRIEIALLSDPWCIQLTLNTDSRHSNTDKYSLTICTYKLYRYTNEDNCRTIKK